jgi:peptide deformylase
MAKRKVYKLPKYEKFLRKKSAPVKKVTREVRQLIQDLVDTLDTMDGVGLAAPQIGVHSRVALVVVGTKNGEKPEDEEEELGEIIPLIDPEIIEASPDLERSYDGCLSIPGLQGYTWRPTFLRVRALDMNNNKVEYYFEGFDARVAAHEIDHLDGILYFDRLKTLNDLYYLVPDPEDDEKVKFLPYLEVHPEFQATPHPMPGMPTTGVKTIADE